MLNPISHISIAFLAIAAALPVSAQDTQFEGEVKLPAIARFRKLPMRMMSEVAIPKPTQTVVLQPGLIEFFDNLLRASTEPELLIDLADSLARIARGQHGDISGSEEPLRKLLTHENKNVRRAAASALVLGDAKDSAAELLQLSENGNDRLRQLIEPALAKWAFAPAADAWQERITNGTGSSTAMSLAVKGLAAVNHTAAAEAVAAVVKNQDASFQNRYDAANALCVLNPALAADVAIPFETGGLRDRLLAVAMLNTDREESLSRLTAFCSDKQNAVAAQAWEQIERLNPELLRERVADGSQHKDSGVRLTAVRVMQRFPSATSCDLLDNVLGDEHIEVRNAARTALLLYAKTNADLHKQIVENSEEAVKVNDSWQRTEQSLLIAASLTQTQFTKMCVPLLSDEFEEVNVTAAWLMHLYPDPFVMEEVTAIADERYKLLSGPGGGGAVGLQLAHLIQLAGFLEHKPIQPLCEKQFSKGSILGREGRSAAMWTLGMLHREKPEPELTTKLLGRLNDRHSMMPELDLVRRMALMSVGRMMVKSEVEHVRTAYKDDPPGTLIPESARWVLKRFGETDIPPMRIQADSEQRVGGWKIFPLADREE